MRAVLPLSPLLTGRQGWPKLRRRSFLPKVQQRSRHLTGASVNCVPMELNLWGGNVLHIQISRTTIFLFFIYFSMDIIRDVVVSFARPDPPGCLDPAKEYLSDSFELFRDGTHSFFDSLHGLFLPVYCWVEARAGNIWCYLVRTFSAIFA